MPQNRSFSFYQSSRQASLSSSRAWVRLAVVFLIALIARLLDAAPVSSEGQASKPDVPVTSTSAIFAEDFPVIVAMGPGLAFVGDLTGWTFNVTGATQLNVDYPVFYGMDTSVNIWRRNTTETETGIQLLPTAYYLFEVLRSKEVYPYFGISVGPTVMVRTTGQGQAADSTTSLSLSVLFRSGLAVSLASNAWFHFEPKFGLLAGKMIFLPQITAAFLF